VRANDIQIDKKVEAAKPELKRQAQEWASITQDPHADLFVFVGRWCKQKGDETSRVLHLPPPTGLFVSTGIDLIADVMPSLYVYSTVLTVINA
jgi:hypothetical protein